jgi:hypothetical protein
MKKITRITSGRFTGLLCLATVGGALVGCAAPPPPAPPPPPMVAAPMRAEHPHYLHALSDLRFARWLINRPEEFDVAREQHHAIEEIDHALGEIRRASIDDGQPPDAHPPIDAQLDQRGRLHRARELIDSARRDLSFEEDNYAALGWRNAALQHVDAAHRAVDRAIRDKHWE